MKFFFLFISLVFTSSFILASTWHYNDGITLSSFNESDCSVTQGIGTRFIPHGIDVPASEWCLFDVDDAYGSTPPRENKPYSSGYVITLTNGTTCSDYRSDGKVPVGYHMIVCPISATVPTCVLPETWDIDTLSCKIPTPTCQLPNTTFPTPATNEQVLFNWQEDNNRSTECVNLSASIQEQTQGCKKEYRCVKAEDEDKDKCRNIPVGSYVTPTAGVFHEDITLIGTDVSLHYQSDYLSNTTIAHGWSLNLHHTLDGDYLHLGSGTLLNIKAYKSSENNTTTISLGGESYIFDSSNRHTLTKDSYTQKTLYSFEYNSNNSLSSVVDAFSNVTTINRDANDIITSITAPHGQINYIYLDANKDLINVTYEDNSEYKFIYEEHLMLSETEPNGNEFIHEFDANGKVVKVVDAEQGIWGFSNTANDTYNETVVNKASGDVTTYRDYFLADGSMVSKTIVASGDTFNTSSSIDGTSSISDRCGVSTSVNYQTDKDPLTHKRVPSSVTTQMPSGLSKTTNYSQNYTFASDALVKKESSVESNGAVATSVRDYNLSNETITSPEGRVSTISYNPETLLPTKIEVANLKPIIYKYDEEGRVTKIKQGPRRVKYTYDARGNVSEITNLQNETTTLYSYDEKDRLTQTTLADGHSVKFSYDKNGNRVRLTTPTPSEHTFEYNGVNKRTSMSSPLGFKTLYSYDKQKRVTSITRASGKSIVNTYEDGRLKSLSTDDGVTEYAYSCADKISSISNATENILYTYDGDLLTELKSQGILNQSINYSYNNDFRPTSLEYAGAATTYTYDKDGYLTSSAGFSISRDPLNAQVTNISDGVMNQEFTYNQFGDIKTKKSQNFKLRLKRQKAKIARKKEVVVNYVQAKNRIKKQRTKNVYDYTYDNRDRLISVLKNDEEVESYTYDANGNRLQATVHGVTTTASYTLDDNLEVYGDVTYRYDEDGYLVEKVTPDATTTYTYNTLGALTSASTPTKSITYHLNALNQRVAKEVNNEIVEKYLWANLTTLLATYDKDDNLVQRFNYADARMPISMTQDNQTYYLHYDQVGGLRVVTDKNHNIVKEITYDTFGNILQDTNQNFKVPFGFAGGLHDRDTNLVHFGYREYDPQTGKWTAKDPIGFDGGDANLYGYVLGDPVNFVDPEGLFRFGTRPLSIFSKKFGPFYHEHGFFDNGADVGYFPEGIRGDDSNLLPNYKMLPAHYNDNIMMDALNSLLNSGRWLSDGTNCKNKKYDMSCDYDLAWDNCQDFSDALRQEYRRLGGTTR
jgi:RHS repeat-associated protein